MANDEQVYQLKDPQLEAFLLTIEKEEYPKWLETKDILSDYLEDNGDNRAVKVRETKIEWPKQLLTRAMILARQELAENARFQGYVDYPVTSPIYTICYCNRPIPNWHVGGPDILDIKLSYISCKSYRYRWMDRRDGTDNVTTLWVGTCEECQSVLWFAQIDDEVRDIVCRQMKQKVFNIFLDQWIAAKGTDIPEWSLVSTPSNPEALWNVE